LTIYRSFSADRRGRVVFRCIGDAVEVLEDGGGVAKLFQRDLPSALRCPGENPAGVGDLVAVPTEVSAESFPGTGHPIAVAPGVDSLKGIQHQPDLA
jgi:hypothetical protein